MPDPLTCMEIAGHPVEGVLHVGVPEGHDLPDYRSSGASPCIYVEPVQTVFDQLIEKLEGDPWHTALLATCSDRPAVRELAETSSQLVENVSPSLSAVPTYSIDSLIEALSARRTPNLLVLNARGAELLVLRGAAGALPSVDGVYVAASEMPAHSLACTLNEIQTFLQPFGLRPRWIEMDGDGRGQAFFSRPKTQAPDLPIYSGNLALGKAARQSSLCKWSHPDMFIEAGGAINGQITGGCGFHTELEDSPWWLVDLGEPHNLQEIRIYNRLGALRSRARTLRVMISVDGAEWREVHDQAGYSFGGSDGRPLRVVLDSCRARYVAIRLAERSWLHLDEVEIY